MACGRAVGITGTRIVDDGRDPAKVAGFLRGGWDRVESGRRLPLLGAIEAEKVKQLVLLDRAADGAAEIIVDAERLVGAGRLKEVPRFQVLIVVKLKRAAVNGIRPALGDES